MIIFKRVLKLFRLKNLSFQKKIYVEIVKQIWIMLKLLRIGYFVKYVTDGIAQDALDFIFLFIFREVFTSTVCSILRPNNEM